MGLFIFEFENILKPLFMHHWTWWDEQHRINGYACVYVGGTSQVYS